MCIKLNSFICFLFLSFSLHAQQYIEQWGVFEKRVQVKSTNNPFSVNDFFVTFTHADTSIQVKGFYDGNNVFVVRFMPIKKGLWKYVYTGKSKNVQFPSGSLNCVQASQTNHGPVQVSNGVHFQYADGKPYYPVGTTAYAWNHMGKELQETTLYSLEKSGFNKIRMCVFPKNYDLVKEEPSVYPYEKSTDGSWNVTIFNPTFFQVLEQQITRLQRLGIEVDLIVFHPYDKGRWGFDSLSQKANLHYIDYLTARLSAYRNVWWSVANEWDFVKSKSIADWVEITKALYNADPYRHLLSIHGSTAMYFNYNMPEISHLSVQDEAPVMFPGAASTVQHIYNKPVIFDEVGYEGNLKHRWGRHSAEEMTRLMWMGVIGGTYVTHGETYSYHDHTDTIFWAKGGLFKGESWKRASFLRSILESNPGPLEPADISRDFMTATTGKGTYLIYFGKEILDSWVFNIPAKNGNHERPKQGDRFKVELIDTWDMKITLLPDVYTLGALDDYRYYDQQRKKLRLPQRPYMAVRVIKLNN